MDRHPRFLLRTLAVSGGQLAALLHLTAVSAPSLEHVRLASVVLMYVSLPAMLWARRRWGTLPPACTFAAAFGYCLVDQAMVLIG